jgi:hypothetical protein
MTTATEQTARADELHVGDTLTGYERSDGKGRHDTDPAVALAVDVGTSTVLAVLDRAVITPRGAETRTLVLYRDTTVYRATS